MQVKMNRLVVVALVAFGLANCKARKDLSELEDINEGRATTQNNPLIDAPEMRAKRVVLIYYVNDTYAPTSDDPAFVNKESLIAKLRMGASDDGVPTQDKAKLQAVASRVEDDWNQFRRVVDGDVDFLIKRICQPNARYDMGLAVFRNFGNGTTAVAGRAPSNSWGYERDLRWSFCQPGQELTTQHMSVPNFDDFRYQSQPLSNPYVLNKAIETVASRFPTKDFRYVLITKSHGNREFAISPHLSVDVRDLEPQFVWQAVAAGTTSESGLGSDKMVTPILAQVDEALIKGSTSAISTMNIKVGVGKSDYLKILGRTAGGDPRKGMYFPIVFMEACKSALELSPDREIQSSLKAYGKSYAGLNMANVGLLYTSDEKGLGYETIDFAEMFDGLRYNGITDFQDAIKQALDMKAAAGSEQ